MDYERELTVSFLTLGPHGVWWGVGTVVDSTELGCSTETCFLLCPVPTPSNTVRKEVKIIKFVCLL